MKGATYLDVLRDKVIVGEPDTVVQRLKELKDELGLDGVLFELNFGAALPAETMIRSLKLICHEVMPRFNDELTVDGHNPTISYSKARQKMRPLNAEFVFKATFEVPSPAEIGALSPGTRRVSQIVVGGSVEGPALNGRVISGSDWLMLRNDGVLEMDARLTIESSGGGIVAMRYAGFRHGPKEVLERTTRRPAAICSAPHPSRSARSTCDFAAWSLLATVRWFLAAWARPASAIRSTPRCGWPARWSAWVTRSARVKSCCRARSAP
jgi:hypothetical protein